jgi:hypothetical protein
MGSLLVWDRPSLKCVEREDYRIFGICLVIYDRILSRLDCLGHVIEPA